MVRVGDWGVVGRRLCVFRKAQAKRNRARGQSEGSDLLVARAARLEPGKVDLLDERLGRADARAVEVLAARRGARRARAIDTPPPSSVTDSSVAFNDRGTNPLSS